MQITIPCSKLSRAMVTALFGNPAVLDEYNYSFKILHFQRTACEPYPVSDAERNLLTTEFQLTIPAYLQESKIDIWSVGLQLHFYHYDTLLRTVEERFGTDSVPNIIRYAYDKYGITEDDLPIETLIKRFYRLRKKNSLNEDMKKKAYVLKKGQRSSKNIVEKKERVRLKSYNVDDRLKEMIDAYPLFVRSVKENKLIPSRVRGLRCYIYHNYSNQPLRNILKILKIKRQTYYTLVTRTRNRLKKLSYIE